MAKLLLVGLDCAPPRFVFERWKSAMPNLSRLMASGRHGRLRSTLPPITVPAWAAMLSGNDPGELGLYGFRNRVRGSYALCLAQSGDLRVPMVWDRIAATGKRVAVLFVPPSYPPRPVHGELVSCFLTPDGDSPHTHPPELAAELRERFGSYRPDIDDYRSDEHTRLLSELYAMTQQHFDIAEHVLRTRKPDFLAMVEIGPDRLHHAFWSQIDVEDPRHVPGNPYANAGREYYAFLDAQLGRLLSAADDDTAVLVVSDHGARPLLGGICINEWLIEHGYLVLERYPTQPTPLDRLAIDWERTRAWAEGGYYARVMLNVQGREPRGCVPEQGAAQLREQLARELATIPGPDGEALSHRIVAPEQVYRRCEGLPPDLAVFFGDLSYRALGTVGHRSLHSPNNDTGPDACNHDWDGVFVLSGPGLPATGELLGLHIGDVAATICGVMGVAADHTLHGTDWSRV
jgi:predicted AlkP superfamily phosphohydrolase/phosphomutase